MTDTEISKINNNVWDIIIVMKMIELFNEGAEDPNRERRRCPAIILAVNRIAKVIGRINRLTDSMITIKGIKIDGVPWGVKWDIVSLK